MEEREHIGLMARLKKLFAPKDLTRGDITKVILSFSFPIILSYLFQQIYTISDAAIVGQTLSAGEVAGVNDTTSLVFKTFVGMTISDTQTGLRALPREAVEELVDVAGDRFEYETNMLLAFKEKAIPFEENKIRTVYIEENKSSHFRTFVDSWRIYKLILAHFFRDTINSLVCAAVDTGLFTLFTALLKKTLEGFVLTAAAGTGARVISSLLNFFLNKKLVFKTNADTGKTMLRYYCLAVPQMLLQILLTDGAYVLFHIKPTGVLHTLIYVVVMILLYIIGYMIQQRWVFAPQKQNEPEVEKK